MQHLLVVSALPENLRNANSKRFNCETWRKRTDIRSRDSKLRDICWSENVRVIFVWRTVDNPWNAEWTKQLTQSTSKNAIMPLSAQRPNIWFEGPTCYTLVKSTNGKRYNVVVGEWSIIEISLDVSAVSQYCSTLMVQSCIVMIEQWAGLYVLIITNWRCNNGVASTDFVWRYWPDSGKMWENVSIDISFKRGCVWTCFQLTDGLEDSSLG